MGIIVNDVIINEMGLELKGCYINLNYIKVHKVPPSPHIDEEEPTYESIGHAKVYVNKDARQDDRMVFTEHSVTAKTKGIPTNPFSCRVRNT
jgi:hypothetical protein